MEKEGRFAEIKRQWLNYGVVHAQISKPGIQLPHPRQKMS
jgi:hypothetical protein